MGRLFQRLWNLLDGWLQLAAVTPRVLTVLEIACPGVVVMLALVWARRMWVSTRREKRK